MGAFYSNFAGKDAMLQELMELRIRGEIQTFRQIVTETGEDTKDMLELISASLKKIGKCFAQHWLGISNLTQTAIHPSKKD